MTAIPRVLAVLQGGAQHGRRFSAALPEDGQPPALEIGGEQYVADVKLDHRLDHAQAVVLQAATNRGEKLDDEERAHPLFHGFELHVPEEHESEGIVRGHHFVQIWLYRAVKP